VDELNVRQKTHSPPLFGNNMKIVTLIILWIIPVLFARADDDFVSSWTASDGSPVQYVLRVPKKDQLSSFWDPSKGPIPITPEKAIELVFKSDSIQHDKRIWKLLQIQLLASSPLLSSTADASPPPPDGALVTHYSVTVSHRQTGTTMGFLVLMDGRVFQPKLEKKVKAEHNGGAQPATRPESK
jgi:hypothetical protein